VLVGSEESCRNVTRITERPSSPRLSSNVCSIQATHPQAPHGRSDLMSELRSVIDALRSEVLTTQPDARVEEDFAELHTAIESLEAERLRRLAEVDRRRLFERDGHLSTVAWLGARFRVGWGAAREAVRLARGLERMIPVRDAFEAGAISLSAVRVIAEARESEPEGFDDAQAMLIEAGSRLSINDLRRVTTHWQHVLRRARRPNAGSTTSRRARRDRSRVARRKRTTGCCRRATTCRRHDPVRDPDITWDS
jgi:hypothetical protein